MEALHDLLGDEDLADVLAADGLAAADNNDDEGDDDWDDDWDAFGNDDNFGLAVPPHGYDDPLVVFGNLVLMGFGLADLNPDLAAGVRRRLLQATTRCLTLQAPPMPGEEVEVEVEVEVDTIAMDLVEAPTISRRQKVNRRHRQLAAGRRKATLVDLPPKAKKMHYPKKRGYMVHGKVSPLQEFLVETKNIAPKPAANFSPKA